MSENPVKKETEVDNSPESLSASFVQVIKDKKLHLLFDTIARNVQLANGLDLETYLKITEQIIASLPKKASTVHLHDGSVDFDNQEQLAEIAESMALGDIVAYDCENPVPESVALNGNWNTEVWITESGEWEAPISGWYHVLAIDGGMGGFVQFSSNFAWGGHSGAWKEACAFYQKGQKAQVTIGAGGKGLISQPGVDYETKLKPGTTAVDEIDFSPYEGNRFTATLVYRSSETGAVSYGAGPGGSCSSMGWPRFFGSGGMASCPRTGVADSNAMVDDGADGAVRFRFYDPAKDHNISIDMATATTIQELKDQIADLYSKLGGGNYNSEEWITESGDWEVPVTGWYEVLIINGGQGAYLRTISSAPYACSGASGASDVILIHLEKGESVPIVIGAGGLKIIESTATHYGGNLGMVSSFNGHEPRFVNSFDGTRGYTYGTSHEIGVSGGGPGGGSGNRTGTFYGAGGGAYYYSSTGGTTTQAGDGANGAIHLRWYDPAKDPRNINITNLEAEIQSLKAQIEAMKNG